MQNQQKILEILNNPYELDGQSLKLLEALTLDYPYCQSLQLLLAKNCQQHHKAAFEAQVNKASAYAVDRRKFQRYISDRDKPAHTPDLTVSSPNLPDPNAVTIKEEDLLKPKPETVQDATTHTETDQETVSREIKTEQKDQETPLQKEAAIPKTQEPQPSETASPARESSGPAPEKVSSYTLLEIVKKRLRDIKDKRNAQTAPQKTSEDTTEVKPGENTETTRPLKEATTEDKNAIPLETAPKPTSTPTQKEENLRKHTSKTDINYLIEKFLKEEPRIQPKKDLPETQEDLSAPSTHEHPQIATETLANVYLAQGKKDKALEVYEKLCLKFPEKSSYFAKKIIDIKNQLNP